MAYNDDNINVNPPTGESDNYSIITDYQDGGGPTGHIQMVGLAYENGGSTWAWAREDAGMPVRLNASDTVASYIKDLWSGISTDYVGAGGMTAMAVDIVSSAGLTISAIVENLIVGFTTDKAHAQVGVYGTGGTAVGMTGSVYVIGMTGAYHDQGIAVFGTGGSSKGGDVGVTCTVGIIPTTYIAVYGATGYGSSVSGDVGVTGYVGIDSSSLIGISGGITIGKSVPLVVSASDGLTHGGISGGLLSTYGHGISLDGHGLSSGVRIVALSTGSTAEYVYVGGGTSAGLTNTGYPLREMDDIFLDIDNLNKVCIVADNADARIRYIGS